MIIDKQSVCFFYQRCTVNKIYLKYRHGPIICPIYFPGNKTSMIHAFPFCALDKLVFHYNIYLIKTRKYGYYFMYADGLGLGLGLDTNSISGHNNRHTWSTYRFSSSFHFIQSNYLMLYFNVTIKSFIYFYPFQTLQAEANKTKEVWDKTWAFH
jgi:hypothetical protein